MSSFRLVKPRFYCVHSFRSLCYMPYNSFSKYRSIFLFHEPKETKHNITKYSALVEQETWPSKLPLHENWISFELTSSYFC